MKREIAEKWVKNLRSGRFEQGIGALRTYDNKFCCLGVLCDIAVEEGIIEAPVQDFLSKDYIYVSTMFTLPNLVRIWAGMKNEVGEIIYQDENGKRSLQLADLNDRETPFDEIANIIEQNMELL